MTWRELVAESQRRLGWSEEHISEAARYADSQMDEKDISLTYKTLQLKTGSFETVIQLLVEQAKSRKSRNN